eukprot:m.229259 g.229259  ORF g.229259 m.229259 type:complete len:94 (-) comp17334_c0_seq25:2213-2494(-)
MSRLLKNCLHLFFPFRLDQHQNEYHKPANDSERCVPAMAIIMMVRRSICYHVLTYSLDLRPLVLFQAQQNRFVVAIHHLAKTRFPLASTCRCT